MKNLKLVMIVTLLTFTAVSIAKTGQYIEKLAKETVSISLNDALQDPGLVAAIYDQLDKSMLDSYPGKIWTTNVFYKDILFVITGLHEEWVKFFEMELVKVNDTNFSSKVE